MASPSALAALIPITNAAADEAVATWDAHDTAFNIDPLILSNAAKVTGAPQPSPSQRTPKALSSIMQSEDGLPQSPSEDELTLAPTIYLRRSATVTETVKSNSKEAQPPLSILSSPSPQNGRNEQPTRGNGNDAAILFDTDERLDDLTRDIEEDHIDQFEQYQITNTQRPIYSTSSTILAALQPDSHIRKQLLLDPTRSAKA
ncbi:MAG: hypothetical protein Q9182_006495 [Xanthomendoza sp. 2 TL-2023]